MTPNSQSSPEKNSAKGIRFLTSDYTMKLLLSKQYATGTKTEIQTNGTGIRNPAHVVN